ncbi:MAG: hypothetical protein KGY66_00880 [Candidatus Thermoplasmatota archaeon]|nr:hypothetical protein [Candidatus Thermoplasmatota archaeon]MBS3789455.1 hypothetical protein [Candidatus Thermoplasmatota archaeon]
MEPEKALEKGALNIIEGSDHRPVSSLAVQVVASKRKKALIMDGSRTVDPYFMVRKCKSAGLDEKEILKKIMISRVFTAYQYIDLVEKAEEKLKESKIIFLGVVVLSTLFEDEEMNQEEGRWLRSRLIKKIKKLVKEERLYGVIVDPKVEVLQKRNREEKDLLNRGIQKGKIYESL